jgi:general secretion pathway protein N
MSGSGQIAYTVGPNRWQVLAERTNWHITPTLYGLRLSVEDNSHRLFVRPLTVLFTPQNISIGEGESEFPITLLQVFGGLTRTLKLSGQMRAIWHPVTLSLLTYQIKAPFDFEVTMNNLHSVVSPLPQLGSYKISGVLSQLNGHFEVTTLTGPLHIEGQGVAVGRVIQFNGQAQADVGMEDQLMGLLLLMGNMNGRVAHLHY